MPDIDVPIQRTLRFGLLTDKEQVFEIENNYICLEKCIVDLNCRFLPTIPNADHACYWWSHINARNSTMTPFKCTINTLDPIKGVQQGASSSWLIWIAVGAFAMVIYSFEFHLVRNECVPYRLCTRWTYPRAPTCSLNALHTTYLARPSWSANRIVQSASSVRFDALSKFPSICAIRRFRTLHPWAAVLFALRNEWYILWVHRAHFVCFGWHTAPKRTYHLLDRTQFMRELYMLRYYTLYTHTCVSKWMSMSPPVKAIISKVDMRTCVCKRPKRSPADIRKSQRRRRYSKRCCWMALNWVRTKCGF